eukprot:768140-Hanusia_phi.AAC.1
MVSYFTPAYQDKAQEDIRFATCTCRSLHSDVRAAATFPLFDPWRFRVIDAASFSGKNLGACRAFVLAWLGLSCLVVLCRVLSCLVLSCLVLSCLVLTCPASPSLPCCQCPSLATCHAGGSWMAG